MLLQILLVAGAMQASSAPTSAPVFVAAPAAVSAPGGLVAAEDLEAVRGGDGASVSLTVQSLKAVNAGAIEANEVISGAITVGANAFGNFDGVGNFVMNTGHENNIQSTLSVTVTMAPATSP
jgi:hypothetical protein